MAEHRFGDMVKAVVDIEKGIMDFDAELHAFDNRYGSSDKSWRRYFHAFTHAAAINRGR